MKQLNTVITTCFLLLLLITNAAFAQEEEQQQSDEKVIMTKKTIDKDGKERVETIIKKDGKTEVRVTVDGEEISVEDVEGEDLILFKKGDKTYFLKETNEMVNNLDLALEGLEIRLNDIQMPDIRLGVADEENDDDGSLGVMLKERVVNNDGKKSKEVKITEVFEGSAAEEAGLQTGDIITAIDGKKIRNLSQLVHLIKANEPGETIRIEYRRDGEVLETKATLKESKSNNSVWLNGEDTRIEWDNNGGIIFNGDEDFQIKFPRAANKGELGVQLGDATDEGVHIMKVNRNSAAENAGLNDGDIITEIDGQIMSNGNDIIEALKEKKAGENVDISYLRNGSEYKTPVILKKSNDIFHFKNEDGEFKWNGNRDDWNFNWMEEGNTSMGVLLGEDTDDEGVSILGTTENSGAEEAGLEKGDIIISINDKNVNTNDELVKAVQAQEVGDILEVVYKRDGELFNTTVELGTNRIRIRKPRDIDVIFGEKEVDEEMEEYEAIEIPKVDEENLLDFTQLDMYPNPNQGAFQLDFEIEPGAAIVSIANIDGEVVYSKDMRNFNGVFSDRIDISDEPAGVYLLTIKQGDKQIIKKVIYN
ncbi:MAG: PDZ domain-containing protein [Saprospiraceae bacterium]